MMNQYELAFDDDCGLTEEAVDAIGISLTAQFLKQHPEADALVRMHLMRSVVSGRLLMLFFDADDLVFWAAHQEQADPLKWHSVKDAQEVHRLIHGTGVQ